MSGGKQKFKSIPYHPNNFISCCQILKKCSIHDPSLLTCTYYMQEIRGAKKFKQNDIEPSLKIKFNRMYSNIVATGEFAWAPSSGVLSGNDVNPGTSKANIDGTDFEEGNGDSEKDEIPNLDTNMSQMVGGVNMSSSSNTKSSGKRKERDPSEV